MEIIKSFYTLFDRLENFINFVLLYGNKVFWRSYGTSNGCKISFTRDGNIHRHAGNKVLLGEVNISEFIPLIYHSIVQFPRDTVLKENRAQKIVNRKE